MDSTARTDVARLLSGREVTVTLPLDVYEALLAEEKGPTFQDHECDEECQAEEHRNIRRILNIKPEYGEECALCCQLMRKRHASNAERQAAYRERQGGPDA